MAFMAIHPNRAYAVIITDTCIPSSGVRRIGCMSPSHSKLHAAIHVAVHAAMNNGFDR